MEAFVTHHPPNLRACCKPLELLGKFYFICLFGYPFAGELSVSVRPFRVDIASFDELHDSAAAHAGESHGGPAAHAP
jgi:hypothetical protein